MGTDRKRARTGILGFFNALLFLQDLTQQNPGGGIVGVLLYGLAQVTLGIGNFLFPESGAAVGILHLRLHRNLQVCDFDCARLQTIQRRKETIVSSWVFWQRRIIATAVNHIGLIQGGRERRSYLDWS